MSWIFAKYETYFPTISEFETEAEANDAMQTWFQERNKAYGNAYKEISANWPEIVCYVAEVKVKKQLPSKD